VGTVTRSLDTVTHPRWRGPERTTPGRGLCTSSRRRGAPPGGRRGSGSACALCACRVTGRGQRTQRVAPSSAQKHFMTRWLGRQSGGEAPCGEAECGRRRGQICIYAMPPRHWGPSCVNLCAVHIHGTWRCLTGRLAGRLAGHDEVQIGGWFLVLLLRRPLHACIEESQ
jgi:hypothetical protein